METLEAIQTVQLTKTADGTIRVGKTRIALESVIHHFRLGATAEEIAQKFPSLKLAEVYGVISFFLSSREEVEKYLQRQEAESNAVQAETESKFQTETEELRERILARWEKRAELV
ncbi:MAG: DUF433 domain-containing protein [Acidobacteria bacterium]|jgi:uncharacterized protein (DUF433 family)|nr:DUF433 domain-containing protein [Acidobacteriota bacterium]